MKTKTDNTIAGMIERMRAPQTPEEQRQAEIDGLKAELDACMSTLRTLKRSNIAPNLKRDIARPAAERYAMYFNEWHMLKFPGKKFVKATWRKVWTSVR